MVDDLAHFKKIVELATVTILKEGGRGVLVGNGFILTAAHCISFNIEGGMASGDFYIEDIEGADGQKFKVRPLAVEPVADIAVLGALDDQSFDRDMTGPFDKFCEKTKPGTVVPEGIRVRRGIQGTDLHSQGDVDHWKSNTVR